MNAKRQAREEKRGLLRELAELQVEEMAETGTFGQTPHFGDIKRATSQLGKEVLRAARERVAGCLPQAACPTWGAICEVTTQPRTVSSTASSDDFGPIMEREAKRRRFFESPRRVFIGDGLPWNWTIWRKYFRSFVAILDSIHAIQYVFHAAMCLADNETYGWKNCMRQITLCWQGRVDDVIRELTTATAPLDSTLGEAASGLFRRVELLSLEGSNTTRGTPP